MAEIQAAIIGATGYTGSELVRILSQHPDVNIQLMTSESYAGKSFTDIFPQFSELADYTLQPTDAIGDYDPDVIFLALPHGVSMNFVKKYYREGKKIIDLSGDFRIPDTKIYEQWYGLPHVAETALGKAVYGLPELFRQEIRRGELIANPGCYPTSAILALTPLVKHKMIETKGIIIDSKSGITGAGAKVKESTHFPDVFGNFSAYKIASHRHTPEIESVLAGYSGSEVEALFTPHLIPVDRGILTTVYAKPSQEVTAESVFDTFAGFYSREQFVRVSNQPPAIKNVRGSNYCDIHATYDKRTDRIIVVSVIDNLQKGAAGQAVQNMNIMFNCLESAGLKSMPLYP